MEIKCNNSMCYWRIASSDIVNVCITIVKFVERGKVQMVLKNKRLSFLFLWYNQIISLGKYIYCIASITKYVSNWKMLLISGFLGLNLQTL